jgi:glycosyltransferase involved in cell wall biosynthesis
LAEIYSAADLFVNPTLEDNFPTTNLEALACGTPVVTFNTGGSAECLVDGCGLLVERGDLPGLVAAIGAVRKLGKEAYKANCQARAQQLFGKDERFAQYVQLYESSVT